MARPAETSDGKDRSTRGPAWVRWGVAGVVALALGGAVLWRAMPTAAGVPERLRVQVIRIHPHDPGAFTQGLLWHAGKLYESTGQYGRSSVRRVALASGAVEARADLPPRMFGEGLARVGSKLVQLTWRSRVALVWDLKTLRQVGQHAYHGEGWGLCHDGDRLIMSTGSDQLIFRDPQTFARLGEVRVHRQGQPVRRLNELECARGAVYANVWMQDHIARIDPATGRVTAWIDARGLLPDDRRRGTEDVLNGIAYLPREKRFLLTGKNWPLMFEVDFVPQPAEQAPPG